MDRPPTISHGVPCTVCEVAEGRAEGTVRLVGTLAHFDAARRRAVLDHGGCSVPVDTMLLPDFQFRLGSLFEFIGDVLVAGPERRVSARVYRNVDGLDMALYEEVLHVRRDFLAGVPTHARGGN